MSEQKWNKLFFKTYKSERFTVSVGTFVYGNWDASEFPEDIPFFRVKKGAGSSFVRDHYFHHGLRDCINLLQSGFAFSLTAELLSH